MDFTAAMRSEHRMIEHALYRLERLPTRANCASTLQSVDRSAGPTLFWSHCGKEEAMIYPLMDRVFNKAEKEELLSVAQAFEI